MIDTKIDPGVADREAARMAALRRYDVLDSPPDGAFDRITRLAARILQVPIAIVSLVDTDRIWFKSHHGLDVDEVGRDPGLCASAILQAGPYLVTDAARDPRTLANPLVTGSLGLQFYLGVPLTTGDGHNLGTLCVIDVEPREATDDEIATVTDLAGIVLDEIELRLSARRLLDLETEQTDRVHAFAESAHQRSHGDDQTLGFMLASPDPTAEERELR